MANNFTMLLQQQIQQDIKHLSNFIDNSALVNKACWEKFEQDYHGEIIGNEKLSLALFKEVCNEAAEGFLHEDVLQYAAKDFVSITFATIGSQKQEPKGQYNPHTPEEINNAKAHLCLVNCVAAVTYVKSYLNGLNQEQGLTNNQQLNEGQQVYNAAKTIEQELVTTFVKPTDHQTANQGSHAVFAAALSAISCTALVQEITNKAQLLQQTLANTNDKPPASQIDSQPSGQPDGQPSGQGLVQSQAQAQAQSSINVVDVSKVTTTKETGIVN